MEVLARYPPGYHPIPDHDQWWGTGSTWWAERNHLEPDGEVGDTRQEARHRELVRAGHLR